MGYSMPHSAMCCAHLLDAVADFGGISSVTVVGKHGVDDAVQCCVLGTQWGGGGISQDSTGGEMRGSGTEPGPASPALGCCGPAGLQGLPSTMGHSGVSCCPCSCWAEAGSPPATLAGCWRVLQQSVPHPICTLICLTLAWPESGTP